MLAVAEKELERFRDDLQTLVHPINKDTWYEVTDSWSIMHTNGEGLRTERARNIAMILWKSEKLKNHVGAAVAMHDIRGEAPEGLLIMLKKAQKIVKENMNVYITAIDRELIAINKIKSYK